MKDLIASEFEESYRLHMVMADTLLDSVNNAILQIIAAYRSGKKVLLIGNGGSAADAQHIAAELIGRFKMERSGLPALALTTDTSVLTALGNDYGYEMIFSRQIESLGCEGDILIAISTGGHSPNVIKAVHTARIKKMYSIGLIGRNGGELRNVVDLPIIIPSNNISRIQEAHMTIGHILCNMVERELFHAAGRIP
jgi:D-sedoheptulose 7-phosphate isomerase